MTAQPHDVLPGGALGPAKSLRTIRAALGVHQDRVDICLRHHLTH
jgi:hypothetical protein